VTTRSHLALGLSRLSGEPALKPFADSHGAITWGDSMFDRIVERGDLSRAERSRMIIDQVAGESGHITFNMAGAPFRPGTITAAKYDYIMSRPSLRDITTFIGG